MINTKTQHINCAYMFMNYMTSPEVNIQIAEYFGEAPGNCKSCDLATIPDHCDHLPCRRRRLLGDIWYWQTPEAACVDGRTDVPCKDFDAWIEAWTRLKG